MEEALKTVIAGVVGGLVVLLGIIAWGRRCEQKMQKRWVAEEAAKEARYKKRKAEQMEAMTRK